jgi:surface protein
MAMANNGQTVVGSQNMEEPQPEQLQEPQPQPEPPQLQQEPNPATTNQMWFFVKEYLGRLRDYNVDIVPGSVYETVEAMPGTEHVGFNRTSPIYYNWSYAVRKQLIHWNNYNVPSGNTDDMIMVCASWTIHSVGKGHAYNIMFNRHTSKLCIVDMNIMSGLLTKSYDINWMIFPEPGFFSKHTLKALNLHTWDDIFKQYSTICSDLYHGNIVHDAIMVFSLEEHSNSSNTGNINDAVTMVNMAHTCILELTKTLPSDMHIQWPIDKLVKYNEMPRQKVIVNDGVRTIHNIVRGTAGLMANMLKAMPPYSPLINEIFTPQNEAELKMAIYIYSSNRIASDNKYGPIGQWDITRITNMSKMFSNYPYVEADLSNWKVSNVTNMSGMFSGCHNFTSDLSTWQVSNVTDMSSMFKNCRNFTSDLSKWQVSNVTNMSGMFNGCHNFTSDLSTWQVSNVTDMSDMFKNCHNFTSNLSTWNVSKVNDVSYMFYGCSNFFSNLSNWNLASSYVMYIGMLKYTKIEHVQQCHSPSVKSYRVSDSNELRSMVSKYYIDDYDNAVNHYGHIHAWDVGQVTDMSSLFEGIYFTANLSLWDVSKVTNMHNMFKDCISFNSDLSNWVVYNVTDMSHMFDGCTSFTANLSNWTLHDHVNTDHMFDNTHIPAKHMPPQIHINTIFDTNNYTNNDSEDDFEEWVNTLDDNL